MADKPYDSGNIFYLLDANSTESVLPLRKNFMTAVKDFLLDIRQQDRSVT